MNHERARDLLENLLERAGGSRGQVFLTTRELEALATLLGRPGGTVPASTITPTRQPGLIAVDIDETSLRKDAILCLDFGTSFSKAFVSVSGRQLQLIDLPLGQDGALITPSELFIDGDVLHFGQAAHQRWLDVEAAPEALIDAIKQFITLDKDVTLLGERPMAVAQDPRQLFFKRDILVLYLAHLTTLAERELQARGLGINLRRRFTHPAWTKDRRQSNESEMRRLMAEAIVLSRSAPDKFVEQMDVTEARMLLDELGKLKSEQLPSALIDEAVREATAAGAGALQGTALGHRELYLVLDIGAGTTDVAGFICVNNENADRAHVFEVTSAADAKNMAGNRLDQALERYVVEMSGLSSGSAEERQAVYALRRSSRAYKETLFRDGIVLIDLPTHEVVEVTLEGFRAHQHIQNFEKQITEMVRKSAAALAGDADRLKLVATGGGARLPFIRDIAQEGLRVGDRFVRFELVDSMSDEMKMSHPGLVDSYPQIAVAVGGALPELPEQKESVSEGLRRAPRRVLDPLYRS